MDSPTSVRLAILFVAGGTALRLIPHPWNFSPLVALALFSGAYLKSRWGAAALLAVLFLSDAILGFHVTMPFTWGAAALVMFLGRRVGGAFSPAVFGGALGGSLVYFFLTNLGVFLLENLYPKTWAGLWECYVMALPFFRNSVAGDLVYTAALFGVFHIARAFHGSRATQIP